MNGFATSILELVKEPYPVPCAVSTFAELNELLTTETDNSGSKLTHFDEGWMLNESSSIES